MSILTETEARLRQETKELRYLVGVLLVRAGLDDAGVERAFELAKTETEKFEKQMLDQAAKRFQTTPEGAESHRRTVAEWKLQQREFWRDACREDGVIHPDPTAGK
jgi:hypothetical protein